MSETAQESAATYREECWIVRYVDAFTASTYADPREAAERAWNELGRYGDTEPEECAEIDAEAVLRDCLYG